MASDPFAPLEMFAFPLFSTMVAGHDAHDKPLLDHILDLRSKHPGRVRSNRNAWHSAEEFANSRNEHIAWVLKNIMDFAKRALASTYQDWATSDVRLVQYWANVLGPGGWNAPHHHIPTHWSGTYYVSVGPTGNGVDDFSGLIEFLNPTPWQSLIGRGGNVTHAPKEGMNLLFPASILHFVHPHSNEQPRVSIAYNLMVVPKVSTRPA
jgi:uncharacterized protein (TIGR02466 family)